MTFVQDSLRLIDPLYEKIKAHPFNQQLMQGTLKRAIFLHYLAQDIIYLKQFARCHALLAAKVDDEHVETFLEYAKSASSEQEKVHGYFQQQEAGLDVPRLTYATLSYTSYILRTCGLEPAAVGIAALLPCFWVYGELGRYMLKHTEQDNPYQQWIAVYSDPVFHQAIERILAITDSVALTVDVKTRQKMQIAFYTSTVLEWHFWNDSYHQLSFDTLVI